MTIEVALVISLVSVAFSVFFGLKNNKRTDTKDIEERVRNNTMINMKLDGIAETVQSIKNEAALNKETVQEHNDRIIKCEESTKSAHHRLDKMETRMNTLVIEMGGKNPHEEQ